MASSNVFVAVGTVKGKPRRIGLRVGGGNLDVEGMKKHFKKHPFPVKFDSEPEILEVPRTDEVGTIPLHQAVKDPEALKKLITQTNEMIEKKTGEPTLPVEDLDIKKPRVVEETPR